MTRSVGLETLNDLRRFVSLVICFLCLFMRSLKVQCETRSGMMNFVGAEVGAGAGAGGASGRGVIAGDDIASVES